MLAEIFVIKTCAEVIRIFCKTLKRVKYKELTTYALILIITLIQTVKNRKFRNISLLYNNRMFFSFSNHMIQKLHSIIYNGNLHQNQN